MQVWPTLPCNSTADSLLCVAAELSFGVDTLPPRVPERATRPRQRAHAGPTGCDRDWKLAIFSLVIVVRRRARQRGSCLTAPERAEAFACIPLEITPSRRDEVSCNSEPSSCGRAPPGPDAGEILGRWHGVPRWVWLWYPPPPGSGGIQNDGGVGNNSAVQPGGQKSPCSCPLFGLSVVYRECVAEFATPPSKS